MSNPVLPSPAQARDSAVKKAAQGLALTRDEYMSLTADEKATFKRVRSEKAAALVKSEDFPAHISFTMGASAGTPFTMRLKPSGVSGQGNPTYSLPATTLIIGPWQVRLNKGFTATIVGRADGDLDTGESTGI